MRGVGDGVARLGQGLGLRVDGWEGWVVGEGEGGVVRAEGCCECAGEVWAIEEVAVAEFDGVGGADGEGGEELGDGLDEDLG